MSEEKLLFVNEEKIKIYSIKNNSFIENEKIENIKKTIISDSILDLKIINVPIVSNDLLLELIINTVKRHSIKVPEKENIDYLILSKDNRNYEILVFIMDINNQSNQKKVDNLPDNLIKLSEIDLSKKKIYSIYHILEILIKLNDFPEETNFIIKEGNTNFIYTFRDKLLRKRNIYYDNDFETINKEFLFYIPLFNEKSNSIIDGLNKVSDDKIKNALMSLKNDIFNNRKTKDNIRIMFLLIILFFLIVLISEISLFNLQNKNQNIKNDLLDKEKTLKILKSKRGMSDEIYKEYLKITSQKSRVGEIFNLLYKYGNNNITIDGISCEGKRFNITGICKSDSTLEKSFRGSKYFKNLVFNFTKKGDKIIFRFEGELSL